MQAETEPVWLAALAKTFPVGVVVVDAAGTVVWCNDELQQQFGYGSAELVGRGIEQLLPVHFRDRHMLMRSQYVSAPSARPMGTGRELYGLRKDGTEFPLEIGLRPLDTPGGQMYVATVVDMSARRKAEASFHRVIEAAPCGMLVVNRQQKILLANEQLLKTFGYGLSELIGRELEVLIPYRHHAEHRQHVDAFTVNPATRAMGPGRDLTGLHKDGTEFPVEIGLRPVDLETGPCVLATVIDVTERKQIEHHLRRANADLEEFAYAASHDLRSPLRAISDLTTWISEELGDGMTPSVHKNLERLKLRAQGMDVLVGNLLEYARAGAEQSEQHVIEVEEWLREQIELQDVAADKVRFRIDSTIRRMHVNATPLSSVLRNLIANAVAHNDSDNPEIIITVRPKGAYYQFDVTDNGPGVPVEYRERIFKLFQRLSRNKQGSGIGLAMVKRIVESHGGTIVVTDRPDRTRGALFSVSWPQTTRRRDHA
jgi:PAS domain S-box-containing protein